MGDWLRNMASFFSPWRKQNRNEPVSPMVAEGMHMPPQSSSDMSLTNVSCDRQEEPFVAPPYEQYRRVGTHNGRQTYRAGNLGMPHPDAGDPRSSTPVPHNGLMGSDGQGRVTRPTAPPGWDDGAPVFPSPARRPHKEPMRYNGKGDWNDYLGHFIAVAEWNQWTRQECGLQLACCLVDDAREVLGSLPYDKQGDFECRRAALERRFSPPGRESRYSLELMNRTIRAGEDMAAYGHELRRLASRAYPDQAIDERFLIDLFVKGLPSKDIKRHVHMAHPLTLARAVDAAIAWEAFEEPEMARPERQRKPRDMAVAAVQPPIQSATNATSAKAESNDSLKSALESMAKTLTGLEQRLQKMEQTGPANRPRPSGTSRPRLADLECYFCHERGHLLRNCPKKLQAEQAGAQPVSAVDLNC